MQRHLFLFVFLLIIGVSFSQDKVVFKYSNVEEATYNYDNESFESSGESNSLGQIEIHYDKKAVVIDSDNGEDDKQLTIIEKNNDNDSEEMYICAMNGEYYAFTVSSKKKELTLVSADYRYIYKLRN